MPRPPGRVASSLDRAVTPAVAAVALVAVCLSLAAAVALAVPADVASPPPGRTALSLTATGERIALTHEAGAPLTVEALRVRVAVDGTALARQPPVPFFVAEGFRAGPTGPFNVAADGRWIAGETASFAVAGTNEPTPAPGDRIRVRVWHDGTLLADLTATA